MLLIYNCYYCGYIVSLLMKNALPRDKVIKSLDIEETDLIVNSRLIRLYYDR